MRARRWLRASAWAVAITVVVVPERSSADRPCSGVLLRVDPGDALIEERTRNQLVGSRCTLEAADTEPLEGSLGSQIQRADALRAGHLAVAWIDRSAGAPVVMIADLEARRIFARELDADPASSAGLEAIAIVIAQALVALGAGAEIGLAMPAPAPEPAPEPEPEPPPAAAGTALALGVELAGAIAIHRDDAIMGGARGRIGLRFDDLEVSVGASLVGPAFLESEPARYALHRTGGGISAFARLTITDGVLVALGGGVELAAFLRTTERVVEGFEATPASWIVVPVVAPEIALELQPWPVTTLRIAFAADVLPLAPRFGVDDGGVAVAARELWAVSPRITLGIGAWAAIDGPP